MTIRIIQVNYLKFIKGVEVVDPESQEMNELMNTELSLEEITETTEQKKTTKKMEDNL